MMENLNKIAGLILAAILTLTPAFALADNGNKGGQGNRAAPQTSGTVKASSHSQFDNDAWRGGTSNGIGNGGKSMGIGNAYGHSKRGTGTTTPPGDTIAPIMNNITATSGTTTATVTFNTNVPSVGTIFYGVLNPFNFIGALGNPAQLTNHVFSLVGLTASTTYFYVVQASNAIGSAVSGLLSFTTSALPDTVAPVLTSVAAVPTASTTATVAWTTNELSTSKVYFSTTTPVNLLTAASVGTTTLVTSHSIGLTGLTASTTYYAVAQSADASSNSATSSQVTFTTPSI